MSTVPAQCPTYNQSPINKHVLEERVGDTSDAPNVLFLIFSKAECDKGIILSNEIKVLLEGGECEGQLLGRFQIKVQF